MQKSALGGANRWPQALLKTLLIMKLAMIILLFTAFQVTANPLSGQSISLSMKNTEIKKVLKSIERDGDFRFLFNSDLKDLKKKVDFNASNLNVVEAMNTLFAGTSLTYKVLENNLVVILSSNPEDNKAIRITGKVTGENGQALAGASVQEKGTNNGTSTDNSGNFSLTVDENATLVVSNIGYDLQEVKVAGRSVVNVQLVLSIKKADEVVVIGYGSASKRDLTGSVVKVKGEVLASQPNTNALASLQSRVAGLSIVNNADPGSTPDVRIRGTISIGSVNPVYIVDGIFTNNLDFVNPNEIESVEILKDPSSLAVFGFKGAAGAILVTTKKAKAGQLNINFNSSVGVKKLADKIKLANADQFRSLLTFEANNRVQDDPTANSLLNFVNNVGGPGLSAYTGNTDWIDAVTRKAIFNSNNLSIDASSEKNRFHMGLGYNYDEGLVKHTRYERMNININDEFRLSSRIKVGFNLTGIRERLPYNSGALENARRALPIISAETKQYYIRNPYGVDSGFYNLYSSTPIIQNSETNPLATLEYNWDKKIDQRYRVVGSFFAEVNITKELSLKGTWYADISNRDNREYTPLYNLYDPSLPANSQVFLKNSLTAVKQDLTNEKTFQQDYLATYKKKFGDHSVSVTGGFTTYYFNNNVVNANINQSQVGVSIIPDNKRFWYINSGFGDQRTRTSNSSQWEYATVSYLGRVLYNYKGKYYFNASLRNDATSQFRSTQKSQNFWAVGAAWEISKEDFMQNQKVFDYLKIKASTGELGNFNTAGENYPSYPNVTSNASAVFGSTLVPVQSPRFLFDPNLHWETVQSSEFGFEADLLKNKLHVEAAYYTKKTKDLLVLFSTTGGLTLPTLRNAGSIKNSGIELSAEYVKPLTKDLTLTVGGNFTTYKNEVLSLQYNLGAQSSSEQSPSQARVGFPIGYFYGLVVEGVYQSYADILASPTTTINGGGAKPGDLKYKDLDGNGVVNENDRTMIGNPTPDFSYGINIGLKYKGFDMAIDLAGVYGNEIYRVWGTSEQKNSVYNYPQNYTQAWTAGGTSNSIPIVNQTHLINRAPSTYGIEDGSFFRIRNLSIGYNVSKFPKITRIKNARIFASIQNLKTWKKNEGYSPEYGGSAYNFGVDYGGSGSALPRITTVGLNINF